MFRYQSFSLYAALIISVFAAMFMWLYASANNHIACYKDCGETFIAGHQAHNFQIYGFKYLLLEDHATSSSEDSHPFLYTHNVNIANIVWSALEYFGFEKFSEKQITTILIFIAGMIYAFLATRYLTGSGFLAATFVFLLCTDINQVLGFSMNALRVWHFPILFGIIYHVCQFTCKPHRNTITNIFALFILSFCAFGIGYDFLALIIAFTIISMALYQGRDALSWISARRLGFVLGVYLVWPVLRQFQVAYVMGAEYWFRDFYYSAVIKVPLLSKTLPLPSASEITQFYADNNILRPPASPSNSLGDIAWLFIDLMYNVTLPSNGFITLLISAGILTLVLFRVARTPSAILKGEARQLIQQQYSKNSDGPFHRWVNNNEADRQLIQRFSIFFLILVLGVFLGLIVFAPLSLHIYLKHQFPLVAAPILLAKAFVIVLVLRFAWRAHRIVYQSALVSVISLFILVDHGIVSARSTSNLTETDFSWIDFVKKNDEQSYAVSWIVSPVATFANGFVIPIKPGREAATAHRASHDIPLFDWDDLMFFGQADLDTVGDRYLRPDYWIYFPVDHMIPFDKADASCSTDYMLEFLQSIIPREQHRYVSPWATPGAVGPGQRFTFGGTITGKRSDIEKVELLRPIFTPHGQIVPDDNQLHEISKNMSSIADVQFNCIERSMFAETTVPDFGQQQGALHFPVRLTTSSNNNASIIGFLKLTYKPDATSEASMHRLPKAQLGVEELIIRMSGALPVVSEGPGHVIFDLREYWSRQVGAETEE